MTLTDETRAKIREWLHGIPCAKVGCATGSRVSHGPTCPLWHVIDFLPVVEEIVAEAVAADRKARPFHESCSVVDKRLADAEAEVARLKEEVGAPRSGSRLLTWLRDLRERAETAEAEVENWKRDFSIKNQAWSEAEAEATDLRQLYAKLAVQCGEAESDEAKARDAYYTKDAELAACEQENKRLRATLEEKAQFITFTEQNRDEWARRAEERTEEIMRLRAFAEKVPTSWLDPLLTGPTAIIGKPPYNCRDIEKLLRAIAARLGGRCGAPEVK